MILLLNNINENNNKSKKVIEANNIIFKYSNINYLVIMIIYLFQGIGIVLNILSQSVILSKLEFISSFIINIYSAIIMIAPSYDRIFKKKSNKL